MVAAREFKPGRRQEEIQRQGVIISAGALIALPNT
jgi:hypothetical protein